MNNLIVRTAVPEDAYALKLRASDLHEGSLWVPGWPVEEVVKSSIEWSVESWTAVEDGQVIAVAGYCLRDHEAVPWLMCSDRVKAHGKTLLRHARGLIARLQREHPQRLICNHLHRPNAEARAFITTLGFRVVPTPGLKPDFDLFYLPPCAPESKQSS